MSLEPGQRLAHYRIERKIGEGGMGVVYVADDTRLGRKVALKVLPPALSSDAGRRARFEREARAVAALNHPNIVTIHSVEEHEGLCFLTMELVDGQPLSHLIAGSGLPLAKFLDLSGGIAEALVAAHRQGVVHRDLKPDNVMVTADGRVKVLDFGLAKLREPAEESSSTVAPTRSITEEGRIIGTVAYMSPEQAEGKPLDHRSDIFSFGIVLYEMATGRRPFRGDTAISTISSILKDTPEPPQQINAALPAEVGRIVRRCLAKEPARRYQSTDDLRNELRELKEDSDSGELTAERPAAGAAAARGAAARGAAHGATGGRAGLLLGGAALLVVLAAGAGWLLTRGRPAPAPVAAPPPFQMRRVTTDGVVDSVAVSPDGRYLAYVRNEAGRFSLRLRQILTGTEVEVVAPSTNVLIAPSFTADGSFLDYVTGSTTDPLGTAQRVSVLGGTPRRLVDGVSGLRASPDGSRLAVYAVLVEQSTLSVAGPEGENPRLLATRKGRDHFDSLPAWSSDGKTIAIVSHRFGEAQQIVLVDPGTGVESVLPMTTLKSVSDIAWVPGREALLVTGSETPANQFSSYQVWEVTLTGETQAITRDANNYYGLTVTSDGSTIAAVQTDTRSGIEIAPVKGGLPGAFSPLFPASAARPGHAGIAWLDGRRLAHSLLQGDTVQVVVTDVASKATRTLTSGPSHRGPTASRDGRVLVVSRDEGAHVTVWKVDPETGREERVTSGQMDRAQTVSRDGAWVIIQSSGDRLGLWKAARAGGDPVELASRRMFCPDISADDRDLLCARFTEADRPETVLQPLAGGEPRRVEGVPEDAQMIRFGADGRSIAWLVNRGGSGELWEVPAGGGKARLLARFEGREISDFQFSPDGSQAAVVTRSNSGDVVLLTRARS